MGSPKPTEGQKKGTHSGAPPSMANGGCYLFFAAFFFPPLAFFAIL
jgi:hypothetical protein